MNWLLPSDNGLRPMYDQFVRGNCLRYFDVKNDVYPPPLMTSHPSHQSNDPMMMACFYFQPHRIKELILKHQDQSVDIFVKENQKTINDLLQNTWHQYSHWLRKDYNNNFQNFVASLKRSDGSFNIDELWKRELVHRYFVDQGFLNLVRDDYGYGNIFNFLAQKSMPTNISYENHEFIWNATIESLLNSFRPKMIEKYLNQGEKSPLMTALHEKRFLLALVYLHFGAKLKLNDVISNDLPGIWKSSKIIEVQNSAFQPGQKLLSLLDLQHGDCPITLNEINEPVIYEDGYIYEQYEIQEWFKKSKKSPSTGEMVKEFWIGFHIKRNEFVYGDSSPLFVNLDKSIANYLK